VTWPDTSLEESYYLYSATRRGSNFSSLYYIAHAIQSKLQYAKRYIPITNRASEMEDSKSDQNSATEPKRTKRDRKKVSLLSSEYSTIYDDANNRKKDPSLKKKKDKRDKKETPTGKSKKDGNVKMSSTTFQWIGDGAAGTQDGEKDRLYYSKLEINVGNHPALIQIGDDILLSSYDTAEADVFDKTVLVNRSIDVNNSKDADRSNVAMNELKPFVGKVVSMWEEGAANAKPSVGNSGKNCIVKHNDSRRGKMKALFQWYYKVSLAVTFT